MADEDRDLPQPLFPRLTPRQAKEMGADRAAAHQRSRLLGAMIAAVDERGYGAVTVDLLVRLAGVSKSAFYSQFGDKEDCFLATFEEIVRLGGDRIEAAASRSDDPRERLTAAFEAFLDLAAEADAAARLVFLASLEVGVAALTARESAAEPFQRILAQGFGAAERGPSDVNIRALVGGTQEVVYRRLRAGEPKRLREDMGPLIEWGLAYRVERPDSTSAGQRMLDEIEAVPGPDATPDDGLRDWASDLESDQARGSLSQRDRILRATAQVSVETGFQRLSVGAISARAGTSNQTFYENFGSKEEAFLAAFDTLALRSYEVTASAFRSAEGKITAGAVGMVAMLGLLARDTLYSRLAFIELPTAGRAGWERAEGMLEIFIGFLEPDTLPAEVRSRPPRVVLEAIGGGIWTIVRQEISAGRGRDLPNLAPALIDFSLLPFGVR